MENFFFCLNAVIPSFLLIATGFLARRCRWVEAQGARAVNGLCFHLFLPVLMFRNAYQADFSRDFNAMQVLLCLACIVAAAVIPLWAVGNRCASRGRAGTIAQAIYRSNAVLLGLPLAGSLAGDEGTNVMGILVTVTVPVYNLIAVVIFTFYTDNPQPPHDPLSVVKSILANPLIFMAIVGFVLGALRIELPEIISRPLFNIASAATPIAMIGVGALLDFENALRNLRVTACCAAAKLLVLPLVGTALGILLGLRGAPLCTLFLILATPCATGCTSMADVMGGDAALSSELVVFTTGISVVTLFLGSLFLKNAGLI